MTNARLQNESDEGTFTFAKDQVVVQGDFLNGEVRLSLKPLPPEYAQDPNLRARFFLTGPTMPLGGYGPVELPAMPVR